MNDTIKETMQRTYRYLYDDGLMEIAAGLLLLASALLFLIWHYLQAQPWLSALFAAGLLVVVLGGALYLRSAVAGVKERVTYPRTGYVAYREETDPAGARWLLLLATGGTAIVLLFLPATFSQMVVAEGIVTAVMLALLGRRLALTRFYLLALLALLLSGIIAGWQRSDLLGSALFLGLTGLLLAASGLLALRRYLQQHPRPDEAYA